MRAKPLVLLLCVLAAACNRSHEKRIAVIPKGTSHEFWMSIREGVLKAGNDFHVQILWNGPSLETEYDRQIQILDSMVAQRVDAIAIAAADRNALVGPIDRAMNQGIPVTVFDSGLDSTNYVSYVATNNVEGGRLGARTLAALLNGKGKVAMIMHVPGSVSTLERETGFTETIAKEFPNIKIVATQFGMSDRGRARAAAENILTANPDLDGLFATAEPSSVGAALAVKTRGLAGKIKLVTFDTSQGLLDELKSGVIDAMIVQDPPKIGYEAVRTLVDKLNGRVPPKRIDLMPKVVRREDVKT